VILFISGEYPPDVGGVGDYTARLRLALERHGWLTDVVTRRHVNRWNFVGLANVLRCVPPRSIVHVQYQAAAFDLLGDICLLPTLLRRFRPAARCVTTFHDARIPYLFPGAGALRFKALRLLARSSDAVIAADSRDLLALGGGHLVPIGANIECAPPDGYARDSFRASIGLAPRDLAVVYFGTLNASKGVRLLLDSFEQVLRQQPRARLLLLGGQVGASDATDRGSARNVESAIRRFGSAVVGTGWLAPRELSAYLLAGDVALLPYVDGASARRGSLLACAAHGLPSVSTLPAGREIAPYVDAVEPDAARLAEAVMRAWREPSRLQSASRALADVVSWQRIASMHVGIYEALLYSRR
jgi:glycosyltransferase involved in cell wall biosynthesis